jgi:alpha-ketoglutarate-dependent taurine dioxygenase
MNPEDRESHKHRSVRDLLGAQRRAVTVSATEKVRAEPLAAGSALPLLVRPAYDGVDLVSWAASHREWVTERLLRHGGLLFRGFPVEQMEQFNALIEAVAGEALEYRERSSPRSQVAGNIYTSTDYPADQSIFFHNENSYQNTWPGKIFFFCFLAPESGGETPIADTRRVYARIPAEVRQRFMEKGVMYVRNFHPGVGLAWQNVFQSSDRTAVEAYCRDSGLQFDWRNGDILRIRSVRPAVVRHPVTGEAIWFNHGAFFHILTLEPSVRDGLLAQFAEEDLPNHSYYGDGSTIEAETLAALRSAYQEEGIYFRWQQGDVLLLDNMLAAHARAPFRGPRKILVGMAEPIDRSMLVG